MMKMFMLGVTILSVGLSAGGSLSPEEFRSPPHEAKPHTWWHWMNGNVTKEGITADLEAMARVGIGGVQIFDAGLALPKGLVAFATDDWYDCLAHANREAKRLGLELCIANCSGWTSSAGPWITPELAMKFVTNTTVRVKGGERFDGALPLPKNTNGFYEDIAVLAFPTPAVQMKWKDFDWQVFRKRGAEHAPVMPVKLTDGNVPREVCVPKGDILDLMAAGRVALVAIARNSGRGALQRDRGRDEAHPSLHLTWDAPSSHPEWTVLRIGYMCNGRTNRSASQAGLGLECDKLDPHALDVHFDAYVGECLKRFGRDGLRPVHGRDKARPSCSHGEGGFNGVLLDSYEVHGQNWTRGFEKTFAARMGYSIVGYLPILAGYPVESAAATERFLKDFRLTLSEQFVKNYAQRLEQRCHENGLVFSCEPYGNGPFNDLEFSRYCDIPMSEFWQPYTNGTDLAAMARDPHRKFMEARWGNRGLGNGKTVAAAAHVWGKRIVGAEAFTAYPTRDAGRWLQGPFELKAQGDRVLADGVNRMIFHRYAHQPWTNPTRYPGMTMAAYGGHFDRTQTWWEDGMKAFCTYLARAQHLLQQGIFVADVLLCTAGEAPDYGTDGVIPEGYDGDRCHPNALAECRVEKGCVIVPGGVRYRVVGTPSRSTLRPEVNAALERIEKAGATVVEYGAVAATLKRLDCAPDFTCDDRDVRWLHRRVGNDEVYFVAVPNKVQKKVTCSFRVAGKTPELWDAYSGTIAETQSVEHDGRTEVVLDCAPAHSVFVVFREKKLVDGSCIVGSRATNQKGDAEKHYQLPTTNYQLLSVTGAWHVTFFDLNRQRNVTVADFDHLASWTESVNTDIRYFSGTATYTKRVCLSEELSVFGLNDTQQHYNQNTQTPKHSNTQTSAVRIILDLGEVKNIATVTVNGKTYPTLWKPPFTVDITDAVDGLRLSQSREAPGGSRFSVTAEGSKPVPPASLTLEIKVTNYWPNRLIGDARHQDDCEWDDGKMSKGFPLVKAYPDWLIEGKRSPTGRHAFSTCRLWKADEPLLESGLIGPVKLIFDSTSSAKVPAR